MAVPPMIVVDASVWLARLLPQDTFHHPVRAWMAARREESVILLSPSLLLPEVAGAITRRTHDKELAEQTLAGLEHLPGLRLIEMDQTLVSSAARLAGQLGLRGTDAICVAAAEYLSLPLCTLDEDLAQRAAHRVAVQQVA